MKAAALLFLALFYVACPVSSSPSKIREVDNGGRSEARKSPPKVEITRYEWNDQEEPSLTRVPGQAAFRDIIAENTAKLVFKKFMQKREMR